MERRGRLRLSSTRAIAPHSEGARGGRASWCLFRSPLPAWPPRLTWHARAACQPCVVKRGIKKKKIAGFGLAHLSRRCLYQWGLLTFSRSRLTLWTSCLRPGCRTFVSGTFPEHATCTPINKVPPLPFCCRGLWIVMATVAVFIPVALMMCYYTQPAKRAKSKRAKLEQQLTQDVKKQS